MRIKYNGAIKASSDKDYASLKGTDFDKAKAILTKDGYKEHEYGDKDDNNGYAVYRKGDKEVELTYEWIKGKRNGEAHAGKVLDVYVDDNINGACGGKKSVKAATDGKIPYDLVSMLVALRDYVDTSSAYVSDEHGKLVDIADSLYNVGRDVIEKMKPEFKKVYEKYGSDYFDKVLDDVSALDSQLTRNNVNDLIADYEDRANNFSGVEGACDGKKSVKASSNLLNEFSFTKLGNGYYSVVHKTTGKEYEVGTEKNSWWIENGAPKKDFISKIDMLKYLKEQSVSSKNVEDEKYENTKWGIFLENNSEPYQVFNDKSEARRALNKLMALDDVDGRIDKVYSSAVPPSTKKFLHRSIKASRRAIMAGPGAGYTIKWNLESIKSINSFNVINVSEPDQYGLITAEADCDVDVTIEIVEAYSYYYGIDSPLNDVPAKMTKVQFEIDPEQWPEIGSLYDADVAFAEELLNNEIYDVVSNGEVMYGGGWSHSTWDGTLTDYDHDDLIEVKVTDEEIIQYVDDAVSGELDGAYDGVEESKRINSAKSLTRTPIKSSDFEFVYDEDDEDYDDGDLSGYYSYDDLTPEQQDYAVAHWSDFSKCANTIYDWFNDDAMDWYHEDIDRIAEEYSEKYGFNINTDKMYWQSGSQGPYPDHWKNSEVFDKMYLGSAGNLTDVDLSFEGALTVEVYGDYYIGDQVAYGYSPSQLADNGANEQAVQIITNIAQGAQDFVDEAWKLIESTCSSYPDDEYVRGIFEGNPTAFTFIVDENGDIEDIA